MGWNALGRPLWSALSIRVALAFSLLLGPAAGQSAPDTPQGAISQEAAESPAGPPPNIVVLLIDDAAFMDLGVYGGEARTPHIDALAERGALFSRYYSSPLCSPSRAMLLTGTDNHRTGVATIPEILPEEHVGQPGYAMRFEPGVLTVADRLRDAGYRTYMTGKWHLGHGPGDLPVDHGFDRSFILDASGADNWEQKPYMPYYQSADWFEDAEPATLPEDFYSSEFLIDQLITYIDGEENAPPRPFFAFVGFQAIHIPIQAPREFIEPYEAVYAEGWDRLREQRWQRARAMGLVDQDAPLADLPDAARPWDSLSAEEKVFFAKSMAVNAGMLEAMDHHIGRLVAHLKAQNLYENTVFVVTSDNGPEPSNPAASQIMDVWLPLNNYSRDLETLGEKGSFAFIGMDWALAASSPGALFKFYATEGGVRVPLIMSGPGITPSRIASMAVVTDIVPTLLDLANVPGGTPDGSVPITGRSLRPVLKGEAPVTYGPDDAVGIEVSGNAALLQGDYKITRNMPPWGDGMWRLHDVVRDPGETRDLSAEQPDRMARMIEAYAQYANEMGVISMPEGYDYQKQLVANATARVLAHYGWHLALVAAAGLAVLLLIVFVLRRVLGLLFGRRRRAGAASP